jgi:hypothetical protein
MTLLHTFGQVLNIFLDTFGLSRLPGRCRTARLRTRRQRRAGRGGHRTSSQSQAKFLPTAGEDAAPALPGKGNSSPAAGVEIAKALPSSFAALPWQGRSVQGLPASRPTRSGTASPSAQLLAVLPPLQPLQRALKKTPQMEVAPVQAPPKPQLP